jgi:hypothetical protein
MEIPMSVVNGQFTRTNSFGPRTDRNYPRFFVESVEDLLASDQAGRRIFRDEERVEIIMPGNPYTRPVQRVTDEHRAKWPKEYEAFKAGQEPAADGTPLEQWPRLRRGQVFELKALGFQTVEHVAQMDDQAVQRVGMGGRDLRNLANAFLDNAARMAALEQLTADNSSKDAAIANLQRQLDDLNKRLAVAPANTQVPSGTPSPTVTLVPDPAIVPGRAITTPAAESTTSSSLDSLAQARPRTRARKPD